MNTGASVPTVLSSAFGRAWPRSSAKATPSSHRIGLPSAARYYRSRVDLTVTVTGVGVASTMRNWRAAKGTASEADGSDQDSHAAGGHVRDGYIAPT